MKILKLGQMLGGSNAPSAEAFENLYSLNFDGVNDYLKIGDNSAYTLTPNGLTHSFWIKYTGNNKQLFGKYNTGTTSYEYQCFAAKTSGYMTMTYYGSNNTGIFQQFQAQVDVGDGDWHHVFMANNNVAGAAGAYMVIDGTVYTFAGGNLTFTSTGTWVGATDTTAPLVFASRQGASFFTACNIDEIAIWDDDLSTANGQAIYNSGTPTDLLVDFPTNLKGYWRNGDPNGTATYPNIADISPTGNDAQMMNMASGDIVTDVP